MRVLLNTRLNTIGKKLNKRLWLIMDSGIMLTNNEAKDVTKATISLENREILLKGTTKKVNSQKGRLLSFLAPLTRAALPFMKNSLTPLDESVLVLS